MSCGRELLPPAPPQKAPQEVEIELITPKPSQPVQTPQQLAADQLSVVETSLVPQRQPTAEPQQLLLLLRQVLAFVGAGLLILGVFAPIVGLPVLGSVSYFGQGHSDGVIVLALAALALWSTYAKWWGTVAVAAGGSLVVLGQFIVTFMLRMSQARAEMDRKLQDNPFRDLAEAALRAVHIEWGFAAMVIGALLLLLAVGLPYLQGRSALNKGQTH